MQKSYILQGENIVQSRNLLNNLVEQYQKIGYELSTVDGKKTNAKALLDLLVSDSLFNENRCLVIENFLSANKKSTEVLLEIGKKLKELKSVSCIFWENKKLTPSVIKKLSTFFVVQEFKLPQVLFTALDNITPQNKKRALELFRSLQETTPVELYFFMLTRHIKLLLWSKLDPETLTIPDWQKNKIINLSNNFKEQDLITFYKNLLVVDRQQKTSQLPENLASSIEVLIASL